MPELPDVELYRSALTARVSGEPIEAVRIGNPFVVRTYDPPIAAVTGRAVRAIRRLGKRLVFELDGSLFLVVHLMIAGRLRWREQGAAIPGKIGLLAFDFPEGTLLLTEAGSKRQAAVHVVEGEAALDEHDPGGLEVLDADLPAFAARLVADNHTLKRALTDPHIFSGIGNAYSDEILHAARLSPMKLTASLTDEEKGGCFSRRGRRCRSGSSGWRGKPARTFPKRSRRSGRRWRSTASSANPARPAEIPCSGSSTRTTKPTTAPVARPRAGCSPIGRCRACSAATGRKRSRKWSRASAAEPIRRWLTPSEA